METKQEIKCSLRKEKYYGYQQTFKGDGGIAD